MKYLSVICLLGLMSCAHQHRGVASLDGAPVAHDTMALGNVKATAVKTVDQQDVCFDISIVMKGVKKEEAMASNWTVAWVDQKSQYHLLNTNQRNPASAPEGGQIIAPYGAYEEWTNTFKTCAPKARLGDVKSLVLTPKDLTYKDDKGLHLNWN